MLPVARGNNASHQRFSGRIDGNNEINSDDSVSNALNVQYHFVAIYQSGVGTYPDIGGRITWYRDGAPVGSADLPFPLSELSDVSNWLGRSQWSGDENAHISYNEFRLYNFALSPAQIIANRDAGPDSLPAPVAQADSITMHRGQKARIDVLANDTNGFGLSITQAPMFDTATVTSDLKVLYTQTTGSPASDTFTYQITNLTGQLLGNFF